MDGIEHLLQCPETTNKPQIDFQTLSADHILLGKPVTLFCFIRLQLSKRCDSEIALNLTPLPQCIRVHNGEGSINKACFF